MAIKHPSKKPNKISSIVDTPLYNPYSDISKIRLIVNITPITDLAINLPVIDEIGSFLNCFKQ